MSPTVLYCILGEEYGALPEPTRTGYEFFAWYTHSALGNKYISYRYIVEIPEDHTLYAHWVRIVYVITFDTRGGSIKYGDSATKYVSHGNTYQSLPYCEKDSYRFEDGGRNRTAKAHG